MMFGVEGTFMRGVEGKWLMVGEGGGERAREEHASLRLEMGEGGGERWSEAHSSAAISVSPFSSALSTSSRSNIFSSGLS